MRKILIAAITVSCLAGCAPTLMDEGERGGVVTNVTDLNQDIAFSWADKHCKKFGRLMRVSRDNADESKIIFDCVAP